MTKTNKRTLSTIINKDIVQIGTLIFLIFLFPNGTLASQDHLLLSEITLQPAEAEFIEIFNPTDEVIMLEDYYLADNQNYPFVTSVPNPFVDLGDLIVRFPNETFIQPNEVIVIALNGIDFENYYGQVADFEIIPSDDNVPDMVSINQNSPGISNAGEGIALFFWNGNDDLMQDVDLMNAGIPTDISEILDKSDLPGYEQDAHTIPYQSSAAGPGFSTKRILMEGIYEVHAGGNGIWGDDETSEDISLTWDQVFSAPSPGTTDLMTTGIASPNPYEYLLKIFPNPAHSEISISLETPAEKCEFRIINSIGIVQCMQVYMNVEKGQLIHLDLSRYSEGIYSIIIELDNEYVISRSIVKR